MPRGNTGKPSSSLGVVSNAPKGVPSEQEQETETKKQKRMDTCTFSESLSKMTVGCAGHGGRGTAADIVITRADFETMDKIIERVLSARTYAELNKILGTCQSLEIMAISPETSTVISRNHLTKKEKLNVVEAEAYTLLLMGSYHELLDLLDRGRGFFPTYNDKFKSLEVIGTYLLHHLPGKAMSYLLRLGENSKSNSDNSSSLEFQMFEHLMNAVRIRSFHDVLSIYKSVKMSYVAELLGLKSGDDNKDMENNDASCVRTYLANQGIKTPYIWSEREGKDKDTDGLGESVESSEKEVYLVPAPFAPAKLLKDASTSSTDVRLLRLVDASSSIADGQQKGDDATERLDQLSRVVTYMEQRQTNV